MPKKYGYIAIFPRGTSRKLVKKMRSWNAGGGSGGWTCVSGPACEQNVDDIAYFGRIFDLLGESGLANMQRVYATGISNGGAMSHRLACEMSEQIAAIVSIAGANQVSQVQGCSPQKTVPVLQIHGTDDCAWPY